MKVYICPVCGEKVIGLEFKYCPECLTEMIPLATPQEVE